MTLNERIKAAVRDVPDFPKKGILFKDITPLLADPALCRDVAEEMSRLSGGKPVDAVAGIESRGFLFGMMLAERLRVPFIPVRKHGKLPYQKVQHEYTLEYGSAIIEIHTDAIRPGMHVLIHDDLLATGGSAAAAAELIRTQGGRISGFSFLIALDFLKGADRLAPYSTDIMPLVTYY